jgi:hypothetical protein
MNGLLRRAGYPIVVITHENSQACLEALVQGQQLEAWQPFEQLMVEATQTALVEMLGMLATRGSRCRFTGRWWSSCRGRNRRRKPVVVYRGLTRTIAWKARKFIFIAERLLLLRT